jgi:hypothetical protein
VRSGPGRASGVFQDEAPYAPTSSARKPSANSSNTPQLRPYVVVRGIPPVVAQLWRTSIALEAGDHIKAAEIAAGVRPSDIPTKGCRIRFLIDHARVLHGLRGRDDDVTRLLRQAEKLGATRTRHSVWAREIVSEMVLRARRDAGGRELRGLADRMGLLSAL